MIRQWLERRRQERLTDARRRGYGWAWAAYRVDGLSLEEIESHVEIGLHFNTCPEEDSFDLGADAAITDIKLFARAKEAACVPC